MSPDPLRPSQKAAVEASMNSLYLKATKSVMYWRSEADRLDKRAVRWQSACAVSLVFNAIFLAWLLGPANHSNRWSLGPFRVIAGTMSHMPGDLYDQPPAPSGGWDMCAHDTEYWACFDWPGPALKIDNGVGLDTTPQEEADPLFGTTTDQFEARMIPGNQSPQEPPPVKAGVTGWNRQPSNRPALEVLADRQAKRCLIPTSLFRRLIRAESDWRPFVISSAGAVGLAQVMPYHAGALLDVFDPETNLSLGACLLRRHFERLKGWHLSDARAWRMALEAYNQGPFRTRTAKITRQYAAGILEGLDD